MAMKTCREAEGAPIICLWLLLVSRYTGVDRYVFGQNQETETNPPKWNEISYFKCCP